MPVGPLRGMSPPFNAASSIALSKSSNFFAPDPNRVLQYHFGSKIFDDLDKVIDEAALTGGDVPLKGPNGMIDFLKKNDYLPFKVNGPANAIDYLKPDELLERIKEIEASSEIIKKGNSPFFKTPDEIMGRVMQNANEKKLYLESFKRTHPEKYKLYEKRQSEEPFFALGDVGQGDVFSDLADITTPKDKADLLQFPKKETKLSKDYDDALFNQKATNELQKNLNKETKDLKKINEIEELSKDLSKDSDVDKILLKSEELKKSKKKKVKPVDENKRQMTDEEYDKFIDDIGGEERLEAYNFDGTVGDAARILKEDKAYEAEMFDMYKTGKLDPEAGSVSRARMNFLKQRLEEAEGSGDTRLISQDEIFELEGLMKKFRKEDIEFKVQEQPERKLTDEEIKELKDLTDNDDFDFAKGGIIGLRL